MEKQILIENFGKKGTRIMPYTDNSSLPSHVKKYSEKVQSQWRHVFNSVYERTGDEGKAFSSANSVLKRRVESNSLYQTPDYINGLVDIFLGNL